MSRYLTTILIAALCGTLATYADINRAKSLYNDGQYADALNELETLIKKTPKDAAVNYYLGATLYKQGLLQEAVGPLKIAEAANWPIAARDLTEINLKVYNFDGATDHIDRWEEILDKQKTPYPAELSTMRERVLMAKNMLERVEKITVIDTMVVDAADFFKHYRLSADAGSLLEAGFLPEEYAQSQPKVIYEPQSGKELLWGMPDGKGGTTLVIADMLDDGTLDEPVPMGQEVNSSGDANYPFMLDDGVTIYYGASGEGSLGGYDIFITRRNADGTLLQPQNIGMPYNSPYNDYMMVIDNERNIGWFASDRAHIPGKVTIYTFVPSEIRINYEPDSENINDYALLRNISMSHDLEERLIEDNSELIDDDKIDEFFLPMSNGQIYTNLSQFKNKQARDAMRELLKRMFDIEVMEAELDDLRAAYGKGDKAKAKEIKKLEKAVTEAPAILERLTNQIISLEAKK